MSVIVFNGKSSASFNAHISEPPEYVVPERQYETIRMFGHESDIVIDSGQYQNVDVTYKMNMDASDENTDYRDIASKITSWIHPQSGMMPYSQQGGYYILTDSYDPSHFRYAKYKGGNSISNIYNKAGEFDLTFNCKPQRYLTSGTKIIEYTISSARTITLNNPTDQIALPYIECDGIKSITIYNASSNLDTLYIQFDEDDAFTIDSRKEIVDPFETVKFLKDIDDDNVDYVEVYELPRFGPGSITIAITPMSGSTANLAITPYWWEL